jgi:hypothetical protein
MGCGTGHRACSWNLKSVRALPADHVFQSLGSTGSLSSASTPKNTLVCSPQLFAADESPEGFDPQCKSPACRGTLGSDASGAQPIETPRQQVFRPIDDAQVLGAPTLDGGLSKAIPSATAERAYRILVYRSAPAFPGNRFLLLFTIFDRFSCCLRLEAAGNDWNERRK